MKKILVFGFIALMLCSVFVFAESPTLSVQNEMRDILLSILDKLGIIADKDTTVVLENVTVESPPITVEPQVEVAVLNDMPMRGNIVFRDIETSSLGSKEFIAALPNGECHVVALISGSSVIEVFEMNKETRQFRNSYIGDGGLGHFSVNIDNEYPFIRITGDQPSKYATLSYSCS